MTDYGQLMEDCVIDGGMPPNVHATSLGDYNRALRAGFPVFVNLADLARWPRSQWRSIEIDPDWENEVPDVPGVYAIYVNGILNYIGSTKSLISRLGTHLRHRADGTTVTPWGKSKDVTVKFRKSQRFGDWLMLEARLISKIRPPRNKKGVR